MTGRDLYGLIALCFWSYLGYHYYSYGTLPFDAQKWFTSASTPQTVTAAPTARVSATAPQQQIEFAKAVESARELYDKGAHEMLKGRSRPNPTLALCTIIRGPRVNGWVGKIYELTTNGDGWGVISLAIGPKIYVKTWNNAVSDLADNTLIDPHSNLFSTAAALKPGDEVVFSGRFFQSETDCVKESSMTLRGSIKEPEFIMRFFSLAKR